ncbi:hypothetical protein DJ71_18480 [Halorubrum sp. E3]|nr:hypothetical protein DJ71_18480 [Halorubrum sp. E3]
MPDNRAKLAVAGDGSGEDLEADPQARDEKPITVGSEEHTAEPEYDNITSWIDQFENNPLVGVPHQNFAADVTEPGATVVVEQDDTDEGDTDVPTVPEDFPDSRYAGLDLDEALEQWLGDCYIDGWDFDADFSELLEAVVLDRRGRRGTAIIEHAYDDATERDHLLGLRPIKVETVTAYTREGKNIVLRPDDQMNDFESVAIYDLGDDSREDAPQTPAGKTAAIAQYDDVFGTSERDEIPFALDDITVSAYNADTGQLFGRPDTASVADRAAAVKKKLERVDQAVLNAAFTNIIARVQTKDEDIVRNVRDNLDPNSPETVSATNAPVELTESEGGVPDAVDTIQQEIEFVLAAMPTPLYRVGFAGDINRDVTDVQQEDYRDEIRRERTRLEADFQKVIRMKAAEFLESDPHADLPDDVDAHLEIRPPDAESPIKDDAFDADAFNTLMSGLSTAAGPKGGADAIIPRRVIVDQLLDMDADELLGERTDVGDETSAALEPVQTDPEVQRAFEEFTDAELATPSYSPADNHVFGPAMNTDDAFYRLEAGEAYCEHEGEVFDQFEEADTDDNDRRVCPFCGEQLQEYDKSYNAHLSQGVSFGNAGGDPFRDEDTLTSFLDDLDAAADGPVMLGDAEWPADDYSIHDRPVSAVGLSEEDAWDIWEDYADDALALMGPSYTATLANRYEPGEDIVDTPDGPGLVVEVLTESRTIDEEDAEDIPDEIDASSDSPTYVVTLAEASGPPIGFYKASDLELTEVDADVDPMDSLDEEAAAALVDGECASCGEAELAGGSWSPPESWKESDTPARLIALDAFQSMGGDFTGCQEEMTGSMANPESFCGAFIDYLLGGYDYWRGDSFLPGD